MSTLYDKLAAIDTFRRVDKLLELLPLGRVCGNRFSKRNTCVKRITGTFHNHGPFILIGSHKVVHKGVQSVANSELVLENDFAQFLSKKISTKECYHKDDGYLNPPIHIFNPSRRTLESVGGHDVVGKEAVDYSNNLRGRDIFSKEFGVSLNELC